MLQVIRSFFSLVIPILLIVMHCAVMLCFINRWDSVVTITLVPIWLWALVGIIFGLLGALLFKSRLSMLVVLIWTLTALICADETPALLRSAQQWIFSPGESSFSSTGTDNSSAPTAPEGSGPVPAVPGTDKQRTIRVATLNCNQKDDPAAAIEELITHFRAEQQNSTEIAPVDVIFLQEAPDDPHLARLEAAIFGNGGSRLRERDCAIVARGRLEKIDLALELSSDIRGEQMAALLEFAPGVTVELVNVHLKRSIMRYDVWRGEAWREHTRIRIANRTRLRSILRALPERAVSRPRVIGGDFGTPYNDDIYRVLKRDHRDSFRAAGTGWGNSFPANFPLLRIDQIWAGDALTPISGKAFQTRSSDHCLITARFEVTSRGGFLALR